MDVASSGDDFTDFKYSSSYDFVNLNTGELYFP